MKFFALLLSIFIFTSLAWGGETEKTEIPMEAFSRIVIMDGGRKKPMDTYARSRLLQISAKSTFERKSATAWLARVFFTPEKTRKDKIFIVDNPDVLNAVGLEAKKRDRYSFDELVKVIDELYKIKVSSSKKDFKQWSPVEKGVAALYSNLYTYTELAGALSLLDPHNDFALRTKKLQEAFSFSENQQAMSFLEMIKKGSVITDLLGKIKSAEGKKELSQDEIEEFNQLAKNFLRWTQARVESSVSFIPFKHQVESWLSPWDVVNLGLHRGEAIHDIDALEKMKMAFVEGRGEDFNESAQKFISLCKTRVGENFDWGETETELFYNRSDFFYRAEILYGLTFIVALLSLIFNYRWLSWPSWAFIVLAFAAHTGGLACRMLILSRPPVSNLYETFIFVGWICVLLGFFLEFFLKGRIGLILASFSGLTLILISGKYGSDGDTLNTLVAVLNSNFWLSTHVIAITLGYAGCVFAGVIGHGYVFMRILNPDVKKSKDLELLFKGMMGTLGFGLTFSFLGTVLGGIWADQSWGRFWGWDPKENGALLIVLWCAIVYHAKMAGLIRQIGTAIACMVGITIVMLAWFGINLLGVGLHSYGFTDGAATGLFSFIAFEFIVIVLSLVCIEKQKSKRDLKKT